MSQDKKTDNRSLTEVMHDQELSGGQKDLVQRIDDKIQKSKFISPEAKLESRKKIAIFLEEYLDTLRTKFANKDEYMKFKHSLERGEKISGIGTSHKYVAYAPGKLETFLSKSGLTVEALEKPFKESIERNQKAAAKVYEREESLVARRKAEKGGFEKDEISYPHRNLVDLAEKKKELLSLRGAIVNQVDKMFEAEKKSTWGLHSVGLGSKYFWKEKKVVVEMIADKVIDALSKNVKISGDAIAQSRNVILGGIKTTMKKEAQGITEMMHDKKYEHRPELVKEDFVRIAGDVAAKIVKQSNAVIEAKQVVLGNDSSAEVSKPSRSLASRVMSHLQKGSGMLGR